jgi:hypothetical protein
MKLFIEGLQIAARYWWLLLLFVILGVSLPLLRPEPNLPPPLPGATSVIYYSQKMELPSSDSAPSYSEFIDKELRLKLANGADYPGFFLWAKSNVQGYNDDVFIPNNVTIDTENRKVSVFAQGESSEQAEQNASLLASTIAEYLTTIDDLSLGESNVTFSSTSPETTEAIGPPEVPTNSWGEIVLAAFSGLFVGLVLAILLNVNRLKKKEIQENKS